MTSHHNTTHGMSHSRPWSIWSDMRRRCDTPSRDSYKYYGGIGISYCEDWENFEAFWRDMGPTYEDSLSLDRKDHTKDYTKENCQWVEVSEQSKNKGRYCNNALGIANVSVKKGRGGIDYLCVRIQAYSGKRTKSFSLRKYDYDEALGMAIAWRDKMKELHGYSNHHGNGKVSQQELV